MASSDEWVLSGKMTDARAYFGYGSSKSRGLVMAGGNSVTGFLSSVEMTKDGETFETLPDLDIEVDKSCLVVLNDDTIFTCGGFNGNPDTASYTFLFSDTTNSWSRYENYLLYIYRARQKSDP